MVITHDNRNAGAIKAKQCSLITRVGLVDSEHVLDTDDKAFFKCEDGIDAFADRGIGDVRLVLTIIGTKQHFTVISADKDHTSGPVPIVAREVRGDVTTLFEVVDLRVILREENVVVLLALLHVNVGVVGTRNQDG